MSSKNLQALISALLVLAALLLGGKAFNPEPETPKDQIEVSRSAELYSVVKVVDGDTVKISVDDEIRTYRLIGIDTPETVHPAKGVECFGLEASSKAKSLLEGSKVYTETDDSQGTYDKYDRRLAYIFLEDGTNFNLKMIQEGYAYEYTYDLPYMYQAQFKEAEATARTNKIGLWADNACASQVSGR